MTLFRSTKIIIDKTKTNNGASRLSIEVVEEVLMQSNLADN